MAAEHSLDASLGTDPWRSEDDGDTAVRWRARELELFESLERFEKALVSCGGTGAEAKRLRTVIRRLEERVYGLEQQLDTSRERRQEAAKRLGRVVEELETWKQNEPLPLT